MFQSIVRKKLNWRLKWPQRAVLVDARRAISLTIDEGPRMTVCIAALFQNRSGAVLASDQMVTARIPIGYEFEHQEITKIVPISDSPSVYVLAAGDVLLGTEILDKAKGQIERLQHTVSASEATELVRAAYQQVRLNKIIQTELEPRGLSLQDYYNGHQGLAPQVIQIVDEAMSQTDAGVEFIVAGLDEGGYTLHTIENPGVASNHTPIGYCAIGSGAPHAMYSLIEASYTQSLERAVVEDLVRRAKTRSEVAPGVGSGTQLVIAEV